MTTTTPDVQQDRPLPRLKQRYREEIERDGRTKTVRVRVAKRSGKDI